MPRKILWFVAVLAACSGAPPVGPEDAGQDGGPGAPADGGYVAPPQLVGASCNEPQAFRCASYGASSNTVAQCQSGRYAELGACPAGHPCVELRDGGDFRCGDQARPPVGTTGTPCARGNSTACSVDAGQVLICEVGFRFDEASGRNGRCPAASACGWRGADPGTFGCVTADGGDP